MQVSEFPFKLGLNKSRKKVKFSFAKYFELADLPTPPKAFGNYNGVFFGDYGNSTYSDCVEANIANQINQWHHETKQRIIITTDNVLDDYTAITGFNRRNKATDTGTSMLQAASYWRTQGFRDWKGGRHKIDAYVSLHPKDIEELRAAAWLLGGIGVGIDVPDSALKQFDQNKPWDVSRDKVKMVGGHYVYGCGWHENGNLLVVTWGRIQQMTQAFIKKYVDEVTGYLSFDRIDSKGLSPEGFKMERLRADLAKLDN